MNFYRPKQQMSRLLIERYQTKTDDHESLINENSKQNKTFMKINSTKGAGTGAMMGNKKNDAFVSVHRKNKEKEDGNNRPVSYQFLDLPNWKYRS